MAVMIVIVVIFPAARHRWLSHHLQRDMGNSEMMLQMLRRLRIKRIVWLAGGHDQMRSQRNV